ncbi:hypothetical protein J2W22_002440 [Sphingomonas kyeonggiensis]|uniref:hypothetical protein n=1 Tax=Sphingomonas kyeonggiensis TaxID=1268553 RepID=UPI0027863E7F|nr:hypothetical protein [Sphingomonas kyeonggiensis]MDQ0250376.1 hypothetical protein [Sphingomonas kyeonggiensis]
MIRVVAAIASPWLLVSCSPTALDSSNIQGIYASKGCPNIRIKTDKIIAGDEEVKYKYIRIKLQPTIYAEKDIRISSHGDCKVQIMDQPIYIFVLDSNNIPSFDIPDMDSKYIVRYRKI